MRILIITQYYLPETGAPQNRLSGLANEFMKLGVETEVLTAMPNYPQMSVYNEYKNKFTFKEIINGIKVHRAWIFTSQNRNIFFRLLNYFSFVFTSWILSFRIKGKFDYVLCESPPLFLGISAYRISRNKKAGLIFNVSDLWPESAEKLGLVTNKFFLNSAYKLEKWLYKKSVLVSGQTQGICKDIALRFPEVLTHWLPNGIDSERFDENLVSNWRKENGFDKSDFILLYAGIIGHAQGLECILYAAEKLKMYSMIKFVVMGDGPEKEKLKKMANELTLSNLFFFDSLNRHQMPAVIQASDAALVPLRKLELFKGAIPSKIFESLAMKKPILLGVEGEARELFIEQGRCGLFFQPENADDLSEKILLLKNDENFRNQLGENGKDYVNKNFKRSVIALKFIDIVKSISINNSQHN